MSLSNEDMSAKPIAFSPINLMGVLKAISVALVLGLSLTACGGSSQKWKEEVQLSDGKVIVIERELVLERGGDEWASNRKGVKPEERFIRFSDINGSGKLIEWRSVKKDISTRPEIPLILDVMTGQWVIFSTIPKPNGCLMYNKYLYKNGVWVEEKLPPTFEQRATNLYIFQNEGFSRIDLNKKRENIDDIRNHRLVQVGPSHPNCKGM